MVNELLTADVNPVLSAVRFFEPVRSMLISLNVARPLASVVCCVVPLSTPVPEDNNIVIETPEVDTLLPLPSCNCTVTAGLIAASAVASDGCWTKTTFVGVPVDMVNELLTADVNPVLVAVRFFEPVRSMLISLNVARPLASVVCCVVPLSTPVPEDNNIVIETPEVDTLLPLPSCNCTVTAGLIAASAVASDGCWTKTTFVAVPVDMVNELLTADVNPVLSAVRFFEPVRSMLISLNVARPLASVVCCVVPLSTPVPEDNDIVIETPEVDTLLPLTSCNCTVTTGLIAAPAVASDGCWTKTTFVAFPVDMVNELLTADVNPVLVAVRFFEPARSM